jgi:hypothetical protein
MRFCRAKSIAEAVKPPCVGKLVLKVPSAGRPFDRRSWIAAFASPFRFLEWKRIGENLSTTSILDRCGEKGGS